MRPLNKRFLQIRKELGLSQTQFGKPLGVQKTAISKIEKDENGVTEQMMRSVCREYNVNYAWFNKGEGDMFLEIPTDLIDQIAQEYALDEFDKEIVLNYVKLPYEKRQAFKAYLKSVFENLND